MTAKILLIESQKKWYLNKLEKASEGLPESRTIASVQYSRENLDFVPDIVVCTSEQLTTDLALEMYRRGATNVVYFDEYIERPKSNIMKSG